MTWITRSSLPVFAAAICAVGFGSPNPTRHFDEFGDISCENEMARLDNFAVSLHSYPGARGQIIFFAGKMADDKLPKRGEAEARAERIRSYLVKRRGVSAASLIVTNGGYDSDFRIQLWVVPPQAGLVKPESLLSAKEIRYRKGKLKPRDYRCAVKIER